MPSQHHQRIAQHLANTLRNGALSYPSPNGKDLVAVHMPGFKATGMTRQQEDDFGIGAHATAIGQAIVHTIASADSTIISNTELAALRTRAAAAPEPASSRRTLDFHCPACQNHLFTMTNVDIDNPTLHAVALAQHKTTLAALPTECTHQVTP